MAVSSRVTVLSEGRSIATVATADATPRSLAALMVGRELDERPPPRPRVRARAPVMLEIEELWVSGASGARGGQGRLAAASTPARSSRSPGSRATGSASSPRRSRGSARAAARHPSPRRQAAARRRSARGAARRHRLRSRGPLRHRRRPRPQHRLESRAALLPRALGLARAAAAALGHPRACRRADRALPDRRAGPLGRGARALGRQPAEARRGARVLGAPASGRRGLADPRARRRARPRPCAPTCAKPPRRGAAVLLLSEDLDEILDARRPVARDLRGPPRRRPAALTC